MSGHPIPAFRKQSRLLASPTFKRRGMDPVYFHNSAI